MQENNEKREKINGVFSSQEVRRVGTGTTTRKTIQRSLWFCTELPSGEIEVQPLNLNYVPSGPKKRLAVDDFLSKFSPEPEVYQTNVYPKMREINKTIAKAERHRSNEELYSAEMEYSNVLKVDEENIKANFGLGLTYLTRGEMNKAENIFERLVKLEGAFEPEHKHLFNDFGINLRKNGMLEHALDYYLRALQFSAEDEHLYHNIARVYFEKKDIAAAVDNLVKSLEINPRLEASLKFLMWLIQKQLVPNNKKEMVAEILKKMKQASQDSAQTVQAEAKT